VADTLEEARQRHRAEEFAAMRREVDELRELVEEAAAAVGLRSAPPRRRLELVRESAGDGGGTSSGRARNGRRLCIRSASDRLRNEEARSVSEPGNELTPPVVVSEDDTPVLDAARVRKGPSMPKWQKEARERVRAGIRRFNKPMADLVQRDANEGDTRLLVTDFLEHALGYDKYEELTTEYGVKGEFADYASASTRSSSPSSRSSGWRRSSPPSTCAKSRCTR
jgi:hypothetical protein